MATTAQELQMKEAVLPPGPHRLPYVGNLLSLRQDPLNYLQKLQRTYGNMATIYLMKNPAVLLCSPEHVRYVLVEHPRDFSNISSLQGNRDDNFGSEGLLTINGEKHRQQRHAVQPAFHKRRIDSYAAIMEQYTQELLKTWQPGDRVDMSRAMQELTLRIVSKCLFSIDLSSRLAPLSDAFDGIIGSSTSMAEDLLNMLMPAQNGAAPETKLSEKQIHDHILTFLAAGHETTAITLVWTFYLLAQYPQVRIKLQDEIRSALAGREPTLKDLAGLPYLDWVLNESMRLYPPAWLQMRFVAKETELDGVQLPVGTMLILSQWVIHRLPDIWEDAEKFKPERWDSSHEQQIPPGAYFPFGGGPRTCIGMPLAQMEARIILASILQRYTPQPVPGYIPGFQPVITLRPKRHLQVTLMPASSNESDAEWKQLVRLNDMAVQEGAERKGCRTALLGLLGLS